VAVGSVLELGIASVAGLHLSASLPELAAPSYLLGPLKYERQVTTVPLEVSNGERGPRLRRRLPARRLRLRRRCREDRTAGDRLFGAKMLESETDVPAPDVHFN
jgi:hypothetical protein